LLIRHSKYSTIFPFCQKYTPTDSKFVEALKGLSKVVKICIGECFTYIFEYFLLILTSSARLLIISQLLISIPRGKVLEEISCTPSFEKNLKNCSYFDRNKHTVLMFHDYVTNKPKKRPVMFNVMQNISNNWYGPIRIDLVKMLSNFIMKFHQFRFHPKSQYCVAFQVSFVTCVVVVGVT